MRGHAGRLTDSTVVLPRAKFPLHVFDFAQTKMIAQVKDDLVALNLETGNWAGDVLDAQGATLGCAEGETVQQSRHLLILLQVVLQVSNADKFVAERLSCVLRLPSRKDCR
jgi:hypothetical protein